MFFNCLYFRVRDLGCMLDALVVLVAAYAVVAVVLSDVAVCLRTN